MLPPTGLTADTEFHDKVNLFSLLKDITLIRFVGAVGRSTAAIEVI